MTDKLYKSTAVRIIRPMTDDDRYTILYLNTGPTFSPETVELAYVFKDVTSTMIEQWTYMSTEEYAMWKELEF
jgi:hypothetical protein